MAASVILGWVLSVLGIICVVVGLVVGILISLDRVVTKSKMSLSFAVDERQLKILEIIVQLLKEILKYPGGIFFVVGLILLSGGISLLIYRPF